MKKRRINIFAGPSAGKSLLAPDIYTALNKQGYNIELVREVVKKRVYHKREMPSKHEQISLYGAQLAEELDCFGYDIDLIVTDGPTLMSITYARMMNLPTWESLIKLEQDIEATYPSINICLKRGSFPYKAGGRYQNEAQAIELDEKIKQILVHANRQYVEFMPTQFNDIIDYIKGEL